MEKFTGLVQRRVVARGSKSEREAITLVTPERELILRRRGGNAYGDDTLDGLVGKRVAFDGVAQGTTLIVSDWQLLPSR
ncbi:MAG: hypothetical protein KF795_02040 [Labilithrix sp.]|nr:hypothetical protein [Labilithrix sp.]